MSGAVCARCSGLMRTWARSSLCRPCQRLWWQTLGREYRRYRAWSNNLVRKAIERGWMQPAGELSCDDCYEPATCYDHRDYTKPLDVDAVCESCNTLRGPAVQFAAFREAFIRHDASGLSRLKSKRQLWLEQRRSAA